MTTSYRHVANIALSPPHPPRTDVVMSDDGRTLVNDRGDYVDVGADFGDPDFEFWCSEYFGYRIIVKEIKQ